MIDEQLLLQRFQDAFAVEPPAGAYDRLRSKLIATRVAPVRRPWFTIRLPRYSRRVLAAVMIVVLAIAAATAFVAIQQYAHRVVHVKPAPSGAARVCGGSSGIEMVDDKHGWNGTQRTTDGGVSWHDVSAPGMPNGIKGGGGSCAIDANHAWELNAIGTVPYQPTAFVVSATDDGGQTWRNSAPIQVTVSMTWKGNYDVLMSFLDDQHGWIVFDVGTASTPNYVRSVYASSDGGLTWKLIATTAGGGAGVLGRLDLGCDETALTFTSLSRGWLSFQCGAGHIPAQPPSLPPVGPALIFTRDGGRTWSPVDLPPVASACEPAGTPLMTGNEGVLRMSCAWLRTTDAGLTWTPFSLPTAGSMAVDFINGVTGFAFYSANTQTNPTNDLYRTDDSGKKWKVVARGLFAGQQVSTFQFVDSETGYVDVPPGPWWTHDGGVTWTPPPGFRSVGTTICALPPPAPQFAQDQAFSVRMVSPSVGWAEGGWRTTDGGSHWTNVAPPSVPERQNGYADYFLDADHAWIAESAGSAGACVDRVIVLATSDGGASWERAATVSTQLPAFGRVGDWTLGLDFVDADHGWLLVEPRGACQIMGCDAPIAGVLYRTDDGGHHWVVASNAAEVGTCAGTVPIVFASTSAGWLLGCGDFLATFDGGKTWTTEAIAVNGCCYGEPAFIDAMRGWFLDTQNSILYTTGDGGHTWTKANGPKITYTICYYGAFTGSGGRHIAAAPPPGPQPCAEESIGALTFLNRSDGWAIMNKLAGSTPVWYVERTTDGGRTWLTVSATIPVPPPTTTNQSFVFVTPTTGFYWGGGADLFVTHDGGRTWHDIQMSAG